MIHLFGLVLIVGIADSANPSTLAPALYLAAGPTPLRGLAGFIMGVFSVNLVAGLVLMLGPGQALLALVPHPGREARHLLELGLGVGLLVLAAGLWRARQRVASHVAENRDRVDRSSFLVGGGIVLVELPTAVPYFAVIAAIVASGSHALTQIGLLGIFNAAFIAPLVAMLLVRALANERGGRMLERLRGQLEQRMGVIIPALVLLIAVVLVAVGTRGLITHRPQP
jgi:cytochrome c biogenesis protein CcdA